MNPAEQSEVLTENPGGMLKKIYSYIFFRLRSPIIWLGWFSAEIFGSQYTLPANMTTVEQSAHRESWGMLKKLYNALHRPHPLGWVDVAKAGLCKNVVFHWNDFSQHVFSGALADDHFARNLYYNGDINMITSQCVSSYDFEWYISLRKYCYNGYIDMASLQVCILRCFWRLLPYEKALLQCIHWYDSSPVCIRMNLNSRFPWETLITMGTLLWFLPCVYLQIHFKFTFLWESFITMPT